MKSQTHPAVIEAMERKFLDTNRAMEAKYSDEDLGSYACLCAKRAKTIPEIAQMMGKSKDEVLRLMEVAGGCSCGSGYQPWWHKDARGIELFKGCDKCAPGKLKGYRPEVLTDPNYYADEPIEPEDY